jgi:hypothetical protein
MSGAPHIKWALSQRNLTMPRRLVLIALAERANGERICFPSFNRIASDLEISRRAVIDAVEYLASKERKLIERVVDPEERRRLLENAGGSGHAQSNVYRILRPLAPEEKKHKAKQPSDGAPDAPVRAETSAPRAPVGTPTSAPRAPVDRETRENVSGLTSAPRAPESPSKKEGVETPAYTDSGTDLLGAPASSTSRANARTNKKGRRLPDDWQPSERDRAYAIEHNVDPDKATVEFRNYWLAKSGRDACKLDWSGTFQNRVVALEEQGRFRLRPVATNGHASAPRQSAYDANARNLADAIKRTTGWSPLDHLERTP